MEPNDPKMNGTDDRRSLLLANKAKREDEKRARDAARDLEELELEERFSLELGNRGEDFEIVSTIEGFVVVKLGASVLHKRLEARGKDLNETDVHDFIVPQLAHPDQKAYVAMVNRRRGIADMCLGAALKLHEVRFGKTEGK